MTNTDKMKNICLHRAAKFGDKQFVTMLIMETEELDKLQPGGQKGDCLQRSINCRNSDGLTPLYLLCEQGFRTKGNFDEDEADLFHGLERTIANELEADDMALDLEEGDGDSDGDASEIVNAFGNKEREDRKVRNEYEGQYVDSISLTIREKKKETNADKYKNKNSNQAFQEKIRIAREKKEA